MIVNGLKVEHVHDDEREVERANNFMDMLEIEKYVLNRKSEKPKFSKLNEE